MTRGGILCALALALCACDEEAARDGGVDAAPADGGASDAGSRDAGSSDAGSSDAGAPDAGAPPGVSIAEGVCDTSGSVAVAPDGSRVAYVTCATERAVWIADLPAGVPMRFADAAEGDRVRFSPDSAWVLFGSDAPSLRRADASTPARIVASGVVDETRFVISDPDGAPELRLLALTIDAGTRRVVMRTDVDDFVSSTTLIEDAGLVGDLGLVSGSRNTLLVEVEAGGARTYRMVATAGGAGETTLPLDPTSLAMGPVGMGDTHGLARSGAGLRFVEFASGTEVTLETAGVDRAIEWLVFESGGQRFAYYVRDGDVVARLRNGDGASRVLADADATDLWATPHEDALLYASGGRVLRVQDGSAPLDLGPYAAERLAGAHAPGASQLALLDGTTLRVMPTDASGDSSTLDDRVASGSVGYDGVGARVLFVTAVDADGHTSVLRAAAARDLALETLAWDVDAWWPVPNAGQVLYRSQAGHLRSL